jgi:hypothetical protein
VKRNNTSVFITAATSQSLCLLSMSIKDAAQKLRDANAAAVALLITDADKALIDLDMVRTASSAEEQNRIIEETLMAYNAIFDRLPCVTIGGEQLIALDERMSALRQQLIEAGRIKNRRRQA